VRLHVEQEVAELGGVVALGPRENVRHFDHAGGLFILVEAGRSGNADIAEPGRIVLAQHGEGMSARLVFPDLAVVHLTADIFLQDQVAG